MASYYWIKLYHEILDDPKMGLMSAELFSFTIKLFLVAGEYEKDGELPPVKHIAWRLHMSEEKCNVSLRELKRNGIVSCNGDQTIFTVTSFEKRQMHVPVKERVRQHRKRMKNQEKAPQIPEKEPKDPAEDVTKRYTDKEKDKDNITTTTPAEEIANHFQTKTGKCPRGLLDNQTWIDDCQEILDKADGNVIRAMSLVDEAIVILTELGYPRNKPAGLLVTIDNILKPKPKRNGANNGYKIRTKKQSATNNPRDADERREEIKAEIARARAANPG